MEKEVAAMDMRLWVDNLDFRSSTNRSLVLFICFGCSIILHLFHPFHQVVVVGYLMIVDARTCELFEEPVGTGYLAIFYASQVEG